MIPRGIVKRPQAPVVAEPRAREALAAERASKATATVRVETVSPSHAKQIYDVDLNFSDINVELLRAPVLADYAAALPGLVLSGQACSWTPATST